MITIILLKCQLILPVSVTEITDLCPGLSGLSLHKNLNPTQMSHREVNGLQVMMKKVTASLL